MELKYGSLGRDLIPRPIAYKAIEQSSFSKQRFRSGQAELPRHGRFVNRFPRKHHLMILFAAMVGNNSHLDDHRSTEQSASDTYTVFRDKIGKLQSINPATRHI